MPENKKQRERRTCSCEFKKQIVELYLSGKGRSEIVRKYDLTASAVDRWIKQANNIDSIREKEELSVTQLEVLIAVDYPKTRQAFSTHFASNLTISKILYMIFILQIKNICTSVL